MEIENECNKHMMSSTDEWAAPSPFRNNSTAILSIIIIIVIVIKTQMKQHQHIKTKQAGIQLNQSHEKQCISPAADCPGVG